MSLISRRRKIAKLFEVNRSKLRAQLYLYVDLQDLDDALHHALVTVMDSPPDEFEQPEGYFFTLAVNWAREQHRRRQVRARVTETLPLDVQRAAGPEDFDLEGAFIAAAGRAEVREAFNKLSQRQQDILGMYLDDGMNRAQVALTLGTSERVVKRELLAAYASLRSQLG